MMEFFAKIVNGLNLMDDLQSFHKEAPSLILDRVLNTLLIFSDA